MLIDKSYYRISEIVLSSAYSNNMVFNRTGDSPIAHKVGVDTYLDVSISTNKIFITKLGTSRTVLSFSAD